MLTNKEVAELKRKKTELESQRLEIKKKCLEHRSEMSEDDLGASATELETLNNEIDSINEKLVDAPSSEERGLIKMGEIEKRSEITQENFRSSTQYRDAFYRSMTAGKIATADAAIMEFGKRAITDMNGLSVTAGAEYVVPETTLNKISSIITQYGKVYSAITKYGFSGTVTLPLGSLTGTANEANGTDTLSFTFTETSIEQQAVVATVSVKNLLLKNSISALENFLAEEIGKYIGLQLENYVLNGNPSTSKFTGIVTAVKALSVNQTYTDMDYDTICDIQASLESPYGDSAVYIMKRATFFKIFKKMQTADGMPLVTTGIIEGIAGASRYQIDGQPVIFSTLLPDTDSFIYGDIKQYLVNESQAVTLEASTEAGFASDSTVWRGKVYAGGKPLFTANSFVYYSK